LANIDNAWYLLAHDPQRAQIRTFALPRIRTPQFTKKTFERPRGFSATKELTGGFGVFAGTGKYLVKVRFDSFASRLVRERDWHPTQKIREIKGGGIELEMTLGALEEIERWILSWGDHAEVLSPKTLVNSVKKRISTMQKTYR
jgi:proteasome accessory factor B